MILPPLSFNIKHSSLSTLLHPNGTSYRRNNKYFVWINRYVQRVYPFYTRIGRWQWNKASTGMTPMSNISFATASHGQIRANDAE